MVWDHHLEVKVHHLLAQEKNQNSKKEVRAPHFVVLLLLKETNSILTLYTFNWYLSPSLGCSVTPFIQKIVTFVFLGRRAKLWVRNHLPRSDLIQFNYIWWVCDHNKYQKKIKGQPNFSIGIILENNRIWDRLPDSHDFMCILVNNGGLERRYWEIPKSAVFIHPSKLSTLENNCYFESWLLRYHVLKSSCKTKQIIFLIFFF